MNARSMRSAVLVTMLAVCGGAGGVAWVNAQPGQPSEPPRQNDPGRTNPSQPGRTNPSQPGQTNPNQPGQTNPNQPGRTNPTLQPGDRLNQPGTRNQRPFAFESPAMESRFNEQGRRLVAMERRMEESNREIMRKLSDARSLTGQQQNQAVLDILQQIVQEHQSLHQYLVQARTGWTGDLDGMDNMHLDGNDAIRRPSDPNRPSSSPDSTPRNPR